MNIPIQVNYICLSCQLMGCAAFGENTSISLGLCRCGGVFCIPMDKDWAKLCKFRENIRKAQDKEYSYWKKLKERYETNIR